MEKSSTTWVVWVVSSEGKKLLPPRVDSPPNPKAGRPPFSLHLRDTRDPVLRRNADLDAYRAESRGVQVVPSDPRYIDRGRREQVGISRHPLERLGRLDAFLEAAAVRYAPKRSRNILRIVPVTNPHKYLVFVGHIVVAPDVKLVAVLVEVGTVCKI